MLKYYNYDVVFQEVPDEVTLAINLTRCPNQCECCHSPHLREDIGEPLNVEVLSHLLERYGRDLSCVCFMGGDSEPELVAELARHLRCNTSLKTAWYTGRSDIPTQVDAFDYIKVGPYIPTLGGLRSKTTNQRMYKVSGRHLNDITALFWR